MRYDTQNSILSVSFKRDPQEHADVTMDAGRRLRTPLTAAHGRYFFIILVFSGLALGLVMELYRRYVLTLLLGFDGVPPLGPAALQMAPVLILLVIVLIWAGRRQTRRFRQALITNTAPGMFIDTDIYRHGLRSTCGPIQLTAEWDKVRHVIVAQSRIDVEIENFVIYLPERAFADRKAFDAAAKQIGELWAEGKSTAVPATASASKPPLGSNILPPRH